MSQKPRHTKRIYPRAKVRFSLLFSASGQTFTAETADLGYGGAFIGTLESIPVGSELSLAFQSDSIQAITNAQVVRDHSRGMAVEFTNPSADFLANLVKLLAPYLDADAWDKLKGGTIIHVDFRRRERHQQV